MKLFCVLLFAYGVWAAPTSSKYEDSQGSSRLADSLYSVGRTRLGPVGHSNPAGYKGSHRKEADVFWRNYNGKVPRDAIDANESSSNEFIFVGMGYLKNVGMLPGSLHGGDVSLKVTENGRTSTLTHGVQILCSHSKINLRWLKVKSDDLACLRRISGIKLVEGGVENGVKLFIGRHEHEDNMEVGKVYSKAPYEGLHIVDRDGEDTTYKQFEILAFV